MTSKDNGGVPAAIVTGAARRIGAVIAARLHQRGLNVVIHCRGSRREADALAAGFNETRAGSARVVQVDLADHAAPGQIVGAALEAFGRVDVLVNNASAFYPTPVDEATQAHWDELMASNLKAPFFLSQACAPHFSERSGAIVNLVDIHALVPMQRHAIYCQAKAILWPEHDQSPEAEADILGRTPLKRPGRPGDIAGAVAFLALDAPYITGQVLAVDGGRLLNM